MMSTLADEIESLKRRLAQMRTAGRHDNATIGKLQGKLEGLMQRQMNHENMQAEIAKHIAWIEDGDIEAATEAVGA